MMMTASHLLILNVVDRLVPSKNNVTSQHTLVQEAKVRASHVCDQSTDSLMPLIRLGLLTA